jgi:hypothetical protein
VRTPAFITKPVELLDKALLALERKSSLALIYYFARRRECASTLALATTAMLALTMPKSLHLAVLRDI